MPDCEVGWACLRFVSSDIVWETDDSSGISSRGAFGDALATVSRAVKCLNDQDEWLDCHYCWVTGTVNDQAPFSHSTA